MKICVTGGRDFADRDWVFNFLDRIHANDMRGGPQYPRRLSRLTHIVHGGAKGADTLAGEWARERGIQEVVCPANWDRNGKAAGHIRNSWMLDLLDPEFDIVFPCPGGKGTQGCLNRAFDLGLTIYLGYGEHEVRLLEMMRIARGEREEEQEEFEQPNGGAVPAQDNEVRAVPGGVGNGIPRHGIMLGGGGGGGQAEAPVQGRLHADAQAAIRWYD